MEVSEHGGTPKSCIVIGFSLIYHPFWGTPNLGNPPIFGFHFHKAQPIWSAASFLPRFWRASTLPPFVGKQLAAHREKGDKHDKWHIDKCHHCLSWYAWWRIATFFGRRELDFSNLHHSMDTGSVAVSLQVFRPVPFLVLKIAGSEIPGLSTRSVSSSWDLIYHHSHWLVDVGLPCGLESTFPHLSYNPARRPGWLWGPGGQRQVAATGRAGTLTQIYRYP